MLCYPITFQTYPHPVLSYALPPPSSSNPLFVSSCPEDLTRLEGDRIGYAVLSHTIPFETYLRQEDWTGVGRGRVGYAVPSDPFPVQYPHPVLSSHPGMRQVRKGIG